MNEENVNENLTESIVESENLDSNATKEKDTLKPRQTTNTEIIIGIIAIVMIVISFSKVSPPASNESINTGNVVQQTASSNNSSNTINKTEEKSTVSTENSLSNSFSNDDVIAVAQTKCSDELKARAVDPGSIRIKWRWVNGELDHFISGNSLTLYGTLSGTNMYGGRVEQNFACECIVDKENDTIRVNDLNY